MHHSQVMEELRRASRAAVLGLMATSAMTLLMWIAALPGMPHALEPFPALLMRHIVPRAAPLQLALLTTMTHFAYGVAAAALFSFLARPMSVGRGLAYGFALWTTMQLFLVPGLLGGLGFGFGLGLGVGHWLFMVYTLVLHLAYGVTLGLLGARDERVHHATFDELARLRAG
jgi:hypothetical protein